MDKEIKAEKKMCLLFKKTGNETKEIPQNCQCNSRELQLDIVNAKACPAKSLSHIAKY